MQASRFHAALLDHTLYVQHLSVISRMVVVPVLIDKYKQLYRRQSRVVLLCAWTIMRMYCMSQSAAKAHELLNGQAPQWLTFKPGCIVAGLCECKLKTLRVWSNS